MSTQVYIYVTILWLTFSVLAAASTAVILYERVRGTSMLWHEARTRADRLWYIFRLRGTVLELLTTLYFVGAGIFQLTFAPVQPHMVSNYYRTFGTMTLMMLYVFVNLADSAIRRSRRRP